MNTGVHQTHCCDKHGCKYGNKKCPVMLGKVKQEHPCDTCQMNDFRDGDFYEQVGSKLVWHPPLHEIIVRLAKQLGAKGKGRVSPKVLRDLHFAAGKIREEP